MRCPKSRFPIQIIVFDELELIIFVNQGLTLSTASLVYIYKLTREHSKRALKERAFKRETTYNKEST